MSGKAALVVGDRAVVIGDPKGGIGLAGLDDAVAGCAIGDGDGTASANYVCRWNV